MAGYHFFIDKYMSGFREIDPKGRIGVCSDGICGAAGFQTRDIRRRFHAKIGRLSAGNVIELGCNQRSYADDTGLKYRALFIKYPILLNAEAYHVIRIE